MKAYEDNKKIEIDLQKGDGDAVEQTQKENIQVMKDGVNAAIEADAAVSRVATMGDTVVNGSEALTNPGSATDAVGDAIHDGLDKANEKQTNKTLPDAPTPQNSTSGTSSAQPNSDPTPAPQPLQPPSNPPQDQSWLQFGIHTGQNLKKGLIDGPVDQAVNVSYIYRLYSSHRFSYHWTDDPRSIVASYA